MIDVSLTLVELDLIIDSLEIIHQLEGLGGFTQEDKDRAVELIEKLQDNEEDYNELYFDE
jgi:hypothetical protein